MKLNMQAIIMAEKLLNKSFYRFDLSDEETIKTVLYAMHGRECTREEFENTLQGKGTREKMVGELMKEIEYLNQFTEPDDEDGDSDVWVTELVNRLLLIGNFSQEYILREAKLWELSGFSRAAEMHYKEEMENKRFWVYMNMLPHINQKKTKSPSDLITFPWEKEAKTKSLDEEFERGIKIFAKFINSKPNE
jgi:hypothetical protein